MPAPDPLPPRPSNLNKIILVTGIVVFIASSLMIFSPIVVSQTTIVFPLFLACAALGMIMGAAGGEAKVTTPTFTIAGAGAISIILFLILNKSIKDGEPKYHGYLMIRAADPKIMLEMADNSKKSRPIHASIQFFDKVMAGVAHKLLNAYEFEFTLDGSQALDLKNEKCPTISVDFENGRTLPWTFSQVKMIPADYNKFFGLDFIIDKDRVYYTKDEGEVLASKCNAEAVSDLRSAELTNAIETKIETRPVASLPAPSPPVVANPISAPSPASASAVPAATAAPPPQSAPAASAATVDVTGKVIGYVVTARLSSDFKDVKNAWFDIDGKPDSRFPIPDDIVTANITRSVYTEPFHWDEALKKHVVPKVLRKIEAGHKAKIGGDAIIAHDETNNAQYIISPIIELVGESVVPTGDLYPPATLPDGIKGYAYLGFLESDGSAYAEKTFNNYSKPDSLYPLPGDILVATSNVWMRAGPRRWDPDKQDYVNAVSVTPIKAGQYVRVGGDTVLAKGGLSVWAPISVVYANGLADIASQP